MKLKIAAGTLLLAIGIAGAAANDGSGVFGPGEGPRLTEYADCDFWHGGYNCEGSPVASPAPVVIVTPVPDGIDSIDTLPSTGSGETAD